MNPSLSEKDHVVFFREFFIFLSPYSSVGKAMV